MIPILSRNNTLQYVLLNFSQLSLPGLAYMAPLKRRQLLVYYYRAIYLEKIIFCPDKQFCLLLLMISLKRFLQADYRPLCFYFSPHTPAPPHTHKVLFENKNKTKNRRALLAYMDGPEGGT